MALKMILDSLDGLDPVIVKEYIPRDGKFVLDVPDAKSKLDTDKLQKALNDEREVSKGLKGQLDAWGNRKPEEVLPELDKLPEYKAAAEAGSKKLDQTQIDAIVNGRVAPLQRALDKVTADHKAEQEKTALYQQKETRRTIFDAVRSVATETKANPEAFSTDYGGLMLLAERLFKVDDQGKVVVREGIPDMVHGQGVKDVVGELQRQHPYFWPPSNGGGAGGGTGSGGSGGANPFKDNNMTARSAFIKANEHRPDVIKSALQAAGLSTHDQRYVPQK